LRTCYAYDLSRNLETVRVEGLSSSVACPSDLVGYSVPAASNTSAVRKVSTQWHPSWRLEVKRAEPKLLTTNVYNGQPDPSAGDALASCAPSSALLPDGSAIAVLCKKIEQATGDATGTLGFAAGAVGRARVWSYSYNADGQQLTQTDPRGNTTTTAYYAATDSANRPPRYTRGDRASVSNALGQVTSYPLYDAHGNVLRQVEPNGVITDYRYDLRQRLTQVTVTPAGGATAATPVQITAYAYDKVGQLIQVTHPDGSTLTYTYDAAHRLSDISDAAGNTVHYTLDAMGNRINEVTKDPSGNLARQIARSYDALNRLQQISGAAQ
jgi:YD repeat-containing protein